MPAGCAGRTAGWQASGADFASRTATHCAQHWRCQLAGLAIDSYSAEQGALPGADGSQVTFKADLVPYLRDSAFPTCSVGEAANNAIRMQSGTGSIASGIGATAATHSWAYKYQTGEFHVNSVAISCDSVTTV